MSFYIKKAFNFGPLRINFSKSGLGLSFGIKGLRIGSGPNGNYLHAGRKGIYYKKALPSINIDENQFTIKWYLIVVLVLVLGYFFFKFDNEFFSEMKNILTQITFN